MPPLIHIVDDDPQVRAATSYLLSSHGYATEIYSGGAEFLRDARLDRGCVLLDLRMPDMGGHDVQEELTRRGAGMPVIVMSAHKDLGAAVHSMKLGAVDFLEKPPSEADLLAAVDRALEAQERGAGRRKARVEAAARLQRLSPRELQILQGLLAGLSNKAIARQLGLSPRTVEMHRANMMNDLGTSNLSEALRLGFDAGLPPLEEGEQAPQADVAALVAGAGIDSAAAAPAAPRDKSIYEERLRLVLEASTDGAWEWNIATGELTVSSRLISRLGYPPEEAPDSLESLRDFIHPADWSRFRAALQEHLEGRTETLALELRLKRRDGSWAWLYDCGSVVERSADGTAVRMVGTATDISERKERERVRDADELIALAQWGAGAGLWAFDLEGRQLHLCPRSRVMHGLPEEGEEPLTDRDWLGMVHPEDRPAALAALERALEGVGSSRIEYRTVGADGRVRWVLGLGKVVEGEGGKRRFVGLNRDVTDRKEAAQALERAQKALLNVSRLSAMGTLASALAHDLAQPLTAVANFSRGLRQRLAGTAVLEDEKLREALDGAERGATLAADIVARMSRQVAGGELERRPASLSALIEETCSIALSDGDRQGIGCSVAVAPEADRVRIDTVQVQQLMLNLVRNAADALVEVPVERRRLVISARRLEPRRIEVRVADSGPGIAEEVADRLFDPFVTTKEDGTGIGLSICRTIVEAHGGAIRAEAAEEGGAAFVFTLKA
ncbi:MAG: PAS domain-containing protein [Allosphingosinicella sp.]